MNKIISIILLVFGAFVNTSMDLSPTTVRYRCLIQLTNYGGEGAYVITSLLDPDGQYEKTLYVGGDDAEWYPDLPGWYQFLESSNENIDGITGASIQSGGRKVALLEIDEDKLNKGYTLRFESSVEDDMYYKKDLELELNEDIVGRTVTGSGYIRYVRLINN